MKKNVSALTLFALFIYTADAQNFKITSSGTFNQKVDKAIVKKNVLLLSDSVAKKNLILFQTELRVNTDGAPTSYHTIDYKGDSIALNTVANGIVIKENGNDSNLFRKGHYKAAYSVFEKWRDSDYQTIPDGYSITWNNVLKPETVNGKEKPCVFKTGEYTGYFASGTSLTNGLTKDFGECQCNNYVNSLKVPGLVLARGNNILKKFKATVGDLVIAYNPANNKIGYAVIYDQGPPDNLGEGSVLLNMNLLGKTEFPKKIKDTYKLSTPGKIIIAVIPASKSYDAENAKPYTAENVEARIKKWMKENGFDTDQKFTDFLNQNKSNLN